MAAGASPDRDDANRQLGERLRSFRRLRGWSLHDVEDLTGGEYKASVLGAYERGDRALTVARLLRLAELYDVPASWFLPEPEDGGDEVAIDLDGAGGPEGDAAERFLRSVLGLRRRPGDRRVRQSDLAVLASLLATEPDHDAERSGS